MSSSEKSSKNESIVVLRPLETKECAWRDGDRWIPVLCEKVKKSLQVIKSLPLKTNLPLCMSSWLESNRRRKKGGRLRYRWLDLILGGTQLPGRSKHPGAVTLDRLQSAAKMMANWVVAGGHVGVSFPPLENTRGQIGNWFCITCQWWDVWARIQSMCSPHKRDRRALSLWTDPDSFSQIFVFTAKLVTLYLCIFSHHTSCQGAYVS